MAKSTAGSTAELPCIHEFVAELLRIEPVSGVDALVLQAALITGATITVKVTSKENQLTIGENVENFLKLESLCTAHAISFSKTDIREIYRGFTVNIEIWLNPHQAAFDTAAIRAPFHQDSSDAVIFTALTLALSNNPIGKDQILIKVCELHKYGIPTILSADAVRLHMPIVYAGPTSLIDPFARSVMSPVQQISVDPSPSPMLFVNALKANLPSSQQVQEEIHDSHDLSSEGSDGCEPNTERGFTDVRYGRRNVREFIGDAGSPPPASAPLGSTYNRKRSTGKISPWSPYYERGLGRGLKPSVIFANYMGFVLENHDKFANANKKREDDPTQYESPELYLEFRGYMKGQLGKDFPKWEASIPA